VILAALSFFIFFSFNPFDASEGWVVSAVPRPESAVPAEVAPVPASEFDEAAHHAHMPAMGLSVAVAFAGILIAFGTYAWKKISADAVAARAVPVHSLLLNKWYFDELYNRLVVGGTLAFSMVLRWFDSTIIDGLVNGSAAGTKAIVFGSGADAREGRLPARMIMATGFVTTVIVMVMVTEAVWPVEATFLAGLGAVVIGLVSAGLTLFLFWAGAGGMDRYVVDGLVNAVAYLSGFGGLLLRKLQTGKVQTYVMFAVAGAMFFYFVFRIV
jgi:NADH:ubiquinone oxidoreductase subunit 5 (subunit L)/multisubunit Na+/H+ antiporter MnhA subunit